MAWPSLALVFSRTLLVTHADVLPPTALEAIVEECSQACPESCVKQHGGSCSVQSCGADEGAVMTFECAGSWGNFTDDLDSVGNVLCCVPVCSADNPCPEGEVCRTGVDGVAQCRPPQCIELGGSCRAPLSDGEE